MSSMKRSTKIPLKSQEISRVANYFPCPVNKLFVVYLPRCDLPLAGHMSPLREEHTFTVTFTQKKRNKFPSNYQFAGACAVPLIRLFARFLLAMFDEIAGLEDDAVSSQLSSSLKFPRQHLIIKKSAAFLQKLKRFRNNQTHKNRENPSAPAYW